MKCLLGMIALLVVTASVKGQPPDLETLSILSFPVRLLSIFWDVHPVF